LKFLRFKKVDEQTLKVNPAARATYGRAAGFVFVLDFFPYD